MQTEYKHIQTPDTEQRPEHPTDKENRLKLSVQIGKTAINDYCENTRHITTIKAPT